MATATMERVTDIVIGPVRLSYAHIWEPKSINGSDEKYSTSLLIDKSDTQTVNRIKQATADAIQKGVDKFGKAFNSGKLKRPLRDGDEERPEDENYANMYFLNANTAKNNKPTIVNRRREPITDEDEVYSGCYARVSLSFYPFNTNGNKGVAVGLNGIQKVKDGEPFNKKVNAVEAFDDDYEFEDEEYDDDDFLG